MSLTSFRGSLLIQFSVRAPHLNRVELLVLKRPSSPAGTSQTVSSKHVLIMDEIDGMAGNEDRGGIQVRRWNAVGCEGARWAEPGSPCEESL